MGDGKEQHAQRVVPGVRMMGEGTIGMVVVRVCVGGGGMWIPVAVQSQAPSPLLPLQKWLPCAGLQWWWWWLVVLVVATSAVSGELHHV